MEESKYKDLVIGVDFDGTCVTHEYPKVGRSIGAEVVLERLVKEGAKLILTTMRSGDELQDAIDWFKEHKIDLYSVHKHPKQEEWTTSPKCECNLLIDDIALGAPIKAGLPKDRPYINWGFVAETLWPND